MVLSLILRVIRRGRGLKTVEGFVPVRGSVMRQTRESQLAPAIATASYLTETKCLRPFSVIDLSA